MIPIKSLINSFLFITVLLVVGCVGKTNPDPVSGSPEILNRLIANNITPPDFQSRNQSLITLSYTSIDNDLATSCTLSHLNNVTVTQACICGGTGVCSVGVTGVGAYSGAGSFSFNVVAAGKTSTTGKANFNITAPAAGTNVPPVILPSPIALQATTEGVATAPIPFTISDSDSVVTCADVTATSSNTALVPVANIVISGSAPNCRAVITPVANTLGLSNIELTLTDKGTPLPAQTAVTSFTLNVTGFNDPPTISTIVTQNVNEDTLSPIANFTIGDIDSTVNCSNVKATSSNTTLISNASITIAGTAPNCTVRMTPNLNQSGTSTITLTITDNGFPMPAKTATSTFSMVVAPINDAPVLPAISAQTTVQNTAKAVSFTISDVDSTVGCASNVVVTSSNTTIVPNTNIVVSGTAPNCIATITPANNQSGSVTLTVKLTDNGTPMPALNVTRTFVLTISQVNVPPTISAITAKTTNEDTATAAINFTINDTDAVLYCSNVTGTSSNPTLVPSANIVVTGTYPNCNAVITPAANQFGSTTITLTVSDNGTPMPAQTATSVFLLTVNAVNDAPTISTIANKSADEDEPSASIPFTISDIDSSLTCSGSVTKSSSNTTVVPNANIVISGIAPNCNAVITSAPNQNGSSVITLTVTDNGTPTPVLTANTSFTMTINPVVDLSGSLTMASMSGVASTYSTYDYARILNLAGLSVDEPVTSIEVCLGTASGSCDVTSWVEAVGTDASGPGPSIPVTGTYRIRSGQAGAQVFSLSANCDSSVNYFYSVRVTNATSKISNVVSTPGWNFWEPRCLGLALTQWLDASEASTITTATGVSNWVDKSGSGKTVTQSVAARQPAFSANAFGTGMPGLTFNGTSSSLTRASFIYAQGTATIFTAIKGNTITANRYIVSEGRTASATNYYAPMMTSTSSTISAISVNNTATELNTFVSDTPLLNGTTRLAMSEDTGASFFTYSNGVAQTVPSSAPTYTRGTSTIDTFRLGARIRSAADGLWFNGSIGEFIVTNSILTTTQRQKLEGYAAHKWGVSGNIPVAHPYSVTPP